MHALRHYQILRRNKVACHNNKLGHLLARRVICMRATLSFKQQCGPRSRLQIRTESIGVFVKLCSERPFRPMHELLVGEVDKSVNIWLAEQLFGEP